MSKSPIEQELEAIKTIISALEPLDNGAKSRTLQYAMEHLGLSSRLLRDGKTSQESITLSGNRGDEMPRLVGGRPPLADIKSLRDQKKPGTDVEMAAIVAYYLKGLAPEEERKESIGTADISTYFVQAGHPLPRQPQYTLPNAKAAGYFDSAGYGKYRLNPVGHNLVVHTLPRAEGGVGDRVSKKSRTKKKAGKRKRE